MGISAVLAVRPQWEPWGLWRVPWSSRCSQDGYEGLTVVF